MPATRVGNWRWTETGITHPYLQKFALQCTFDHFWHQKWFFSSFFKRASLEDYGLQLFSLAQVWTKIRSVGWFIATRSHILWFDAPLTRIDALLRRATVMLLNHSQIRVPSSLPSPPAAQLRRTANSEWKFVSRSGGKIAAGIFLGKGATWWRVISSLLAALEVNAVGSYSWLQRWSLVECLLESMTLSGEFSLPKRGPRPRMIEKTAGKEKWRNEMLSIH